MGNADEIKSKLDIVDIMSAYINLKAAGSNFKAVCPFHNEKTPSLMVSPEKQIWRCFGCGKGGDLFSFVMEMEGLDFVETLKLLAPKAGVILSSSNYSEDKNKNKLLEILELSAKFYHYILTSDKYSNSTIDRVRTYLSDERALNMDALKNWNIGYSPDSYNDLLLFLQKKGFDLKDLLSSGMVAKNSSGKYYNRFRDRIMFPIKDVNGRVVAFTARINPYAKNHDDSFGKYINSPQTNLYDKSKILFALDKAKGSIKEKNEVILVEGQMDAISAHEAGFKNVVASSGTALNPSQLNLIKRYTNNIVLAFDQDFAGSVAVDRGVLEALKLGLNLKIIIFNEEDAKDPDDLIRKNPDLFAQAVKEAKNLLDYYIDQELASLDLNDARAKHLSIDKILRLLSLLNNKVEQDFWIKSLSLKFGVNESFLREEFSSRKNEDKRPAKELDTQNTNNEKNKDSRSKKLSDLFLSLLLKFPDNLDYFAQNLESDILDKDHSRIYELMIMCYNENNEKLDYPLFLSYINDKISGEDLALFTSLIENFILLADFYLDEDEKVDNDLDSKKELITISLELKKIFYKKKIQECQNKLILAEKDQESNQLNDILDELKDLHLKFNAIK